MPGQPDYRFASAPVVTSESIAIAIPIARGDRADVVVFRRVKRKWLQDFIPSGFGVAFVALAKTSDDSLILAVGRADTTERVDKNSVFMYSRSRSAAAQWTSSGRRVRGGILGVFRFDMVAGDSGLTLTWRVGSEARALLIAPGRTALPVSIAPRALYIHFEHAAGGMKFWVIDGQDLLARQNIRVVHHDGSGVETIYDGPTPFAGSFEVAEWGGDLILLGGVSSDLPNAPTVVAHLIRIPIRCGRNP
ncbi:MAG: hypothetical protein ABIR58_09365 [Gemmatimonadaceae bacterium]